MSSPLSPAIPQPPAEYVIYSDGGARGNPGPAAIGYIITDGQGKHLCSGHEYIGHATNNVAEYTAVKRALEFLSSVNFSTSAPSLAFFVDSQLIANQLAGKYKIKQPHLQVLAQEIHQCLAILNATATFTPIPRDQNVEADALVNQALDAALA